MKIEIVSHCWNYSRLLTLQLSGFCLFPPVENQLTVTVPYCAEDSDTVAVLDAFGRRSIKNVTWSWLAMPRELLMRRAIGRNFCCQETKADSIWMVDCDYVFRHTAIDKIASCLGTQEVIGFCHDHMASTEQADGDAEIQRVVPGVIADLDPARFSRSVLTRAIGGSQFLQGDWARRHGYLPKTKYQRPASVWKRTFEDRAFRQASGLSGFPIDCLDVFRVRHSKRGRFDIGVKL